MAKKIYNNYDDTLLGQYIRAIENPDSVNKESTLFHRPLITEGQFPCEPYVRR